LLAPGKIQAPGAPVLDFTVTPTSGKKPMHKTRACLLAIALLAGPTFAADPAPAAAPSDDQVLQSVRNDLQAKRADIMAKNMTLTADQAAKFWPLFNKFQAEQDVIIDAQLKGVQKFVDSYATLDDAGALALMNAQIDRDTKLCALRQKWLGEFQKVLPAKQAVRVIQIDRRLANIAQVALSSRIPLVY
jgi:Spy/CpxP family protein refolding chaperone